MQRLKKEKIHPQQKEVNLAHTSVRQDPVNLCPALKESSIKKKGNDKRESIRTTKLAAFFFVDWFT